MSRPWATEAGSVAVANPARTHPGMNQVAFRGSNFCHLFSHTPPEKVVKIFVTRKLSPVFLSSRAETSITAC